MNKIGFFVKNQLANPRRVFVYCILFAFLSLVFNGGLLNIYGLHRDHQRLRDQLVEVKAQIFDLGQKLKQAKDPIFVERQALDRYDLAEENDLVFVFADE